WDVQDLDDPLMVGSYLGPNNATDHNFYINGSILHQSNYAFGIRFVDLTDPVNPVERGFFDTSPQDANNPGFGGSWSNYPYFASGVVAVTSGAEGLFVVRLTN
ncbi:MAG: choice-of-anchor B family protein, partial [Gemmatimonadales bacterium]